MISPAAIEPIHFTRRVGDECSATGTLRVVIRKHVEDTLIKHAGNVSQSARELGIERSSLQRMLRRWGLR